MIRLHCPGAFRRYYEMGIDHSAVGQHTMTAQAAIRTRLSAHQQVVALGRPVPADFPEPYEPVAFAGEGSFSEVWKVRHRETGCLYALKRLRGDWRREPVAARLLGNEARVGRRVHSPYVVRVHEADFSAVPPCALLEWIDGVSLEVRLREEGLLPVGQALWIARQTAMGLADLERAGFAHGDIKPSNILCRPGGEIVLIDLGFARSIREERELARPHVLRGTAEYLAPESLSREACSPVAKDIYSLGVMLFRLLAGRLPFEAETTADMLRLQRESKPPLLRRYRPDAPREVADFVARLLAKHPLRRPASSAELLRDLIPLELLTLDGEP